jgi:hypothetical protein
LDGADVVRLAGPFTGGDYRKTMPNVKIFYIPHAGHYIQFESIPPKIAEMGTFPVVLTQF